MLKLRRDLSRAVTILEMIKRREKSKRELLHLTLEIVEKRYTQTSYTFSFVVPVSCDHVQLGNIKNRNFECCPDNSISVVNIFYCHVLNTFLIFSSKIFYWCQKLLFKSAKFEFQ